MDDAPLLAKTTVLGDNWHPFPQEQVYHRFPGELTGQRAGELPLLLPCWFF